MSVTATEADRLARVALNHLGEPGELRMASLVAELGAVELHRLLAAETDLHGLATDVAGRLASVDAARELERAHRLGLRFVVPGDAEWPPQLDGLADAGSLHERGGIPVGLWVKGPLRLDQLAVSVAVVGSRNSTGYGGSVAGEIAATASSAGVTVVSGGAYGIDIAAHRGAIAVDAPTVAVLACGADRVYPQAHGDLLRHIGSTGAVVSETAPGGAPLKIRFLARNRLIAALTRGTVVVEAAHRSGALNTVNWAGRLQRVVAGVPGPVTSAVSAGVHEQLRVGAINLVTSGAEVLELVGNAGDHLVEPHREPDTVRDRLTGRQRQVLDAVPVSAPAPVSSIARVAGLGLLEVRSALTHLQTAGLVDGLADGWRLTAPAHP